MPTVAFTVPGDPVPHYQTTYRGKRVDPRSLKAMKYKDDVLWCSAGARQSIPQTLTMMRPAIVHTRCYFRGNVHPDPESVHKLIKDALWPSSAGGDKYTGGSYDPPLYDAINPRVEVEVRF